MADLKEIKRFAASQDLPEAVVEKDYAISVALKLLSESPLAKLVAFKGGTALRKIYFPKTRFSEDLDFTALTEDQVEAWRLVKETFEEKESNGIHFTIASKEEKAGFQSSSLKAIIKFIGPLAHPQSIRLDISFREKLLEKTEWRPVQDTYALGSKDIQCLSMPEIIAEKVRALFGRDDPKDAFDLYFLSKNGYKPNSGLVNEKLAAAGSRISQEKLAEKLEVLRHSWKRKLGELLPKVPDFDEVVVEVKKRMESEDFENKGRLLTEKQRLEKELKAMKNRINEQARLYEELGGRLARNPLEIGFSGISTPGVFTGTIFPFDKMKEIEEIKKMLQEYRDNQTKLAKIKRELGEEEDYADRYVR